MKKYQLAPSILAADFARLGQSINQVEANGVDILHIDIMDGHFVPNISFGAPIIRSIRKVSDSFFDTHLMINQPERYITDFVKAGADRLTVHVESSQHLHRLIQMIKAQGIEAGVTLNPATPVSCLEPVLADVDLVLVMSVNPGFGGQSFIPSALQRIKYLAEYRQQHQLDYLIEVDGGIKLENAKSVVEAGADILVAGSAIFGSQDIDGTIKAFYSL